VQALNEKSGNQPTHSGSKIIGLGWVGFLILDSLENKL